MPDPAYHVAAWTDFFVAAAGASAALAGLVFVAVSINVESILKYPGLPERGISTVLLFASVLVVSLFGLTPGQSHPCVRASRSSPSASSRRPTCRQMR